MQDPFVDGLKQKTQAAGDELDADVLVLAGPIGPTEYQRVSELTRRQGRRTNVLFMLSTFGGNADSAYRIARTLQSTYGRVTIFVHSYCKSAGTLLALGADEIVMSASGELGPLDIQLLHRDLAERTSGLTPTQALATLRDEVSRSFEDVFLHIRRKTRLASDAAAEVAGAIVTGLYSTIYDKLDPVKLGENDRAMLIAREYGERLSGGRCLLKPKAIEKLIGGYPSHEFVIDFAEASGLFRSIREPSRAEAELEQWIRGNLEAALLDDEEDSLIDLLPTSDTDRDSDEQICTQLHTNDGTTVGSPTGNGAPTCPDDTRSEEPTEAAR